MKLSLAFVFALLTSLTASLSRAEDTIKIGILHSLSGTMAISEMTLKDTILMLIEEQNAQGGLLGKPLEAVVVDPASNWAMFGEQARALVERDQVVAIFGMWTSVSRKAVLQAMQEIDVLAFYPVQYEGEESAKNMFYFGATPNQQAIPAVNFLREQLGIERWILAGTDYVYPRTTNKIISQYLRMVGVSDDDIFINYTPFGHSDWSDIIDDMIRVAQQGKKTAIISTINGDANIHFYQQLNKRGIKANTLPVMAFSIGEEELSQLDAKKLAGHYASWNYFMSLDDLNNKQFIQRWHRYIGDTTRPTNDPMEAHYIGFNMWVKAVQKAGTTIPDKVSEAIIGTQVSNLSGSNAIMLPNHHITKPVFVGKVRADGQFDIVFRSTQSIEGDAWSDYLKGSMHLISDWRVPINCGKYDSLIEKCLQQ